MITARYFVTVCLWISLIPGKVLADDDPKEPLLHKTAFGLFVHDRGPSSDQHESGLDPNWELQLNPPKWRAWGWIASPYPTFGVTPNFHGDTSVFYGALTYEPNLSHEAWDRFTWGLTRHLFVAGSLGVALHNGPLHKDKIGCDQHSDCGFGYRALPRLSGEIGFKIRKNLGASLFYDHMSHKGVLPGENEGIDHIGFRYFYIFGQSQ